MKQIPKKITLRNITGLKLYMLNTDTAEIICGSFEAQIINIHEEDDIRRKFITDCGQELFFGVDKQYFLKRIDSVYEKIECYKSESLFIYDFSDECEQSFSELYETSDWYLIFTSLEKAKEVRKTILIPDLIKHKTNSMNKQMEEYMNSVSELEHLEIKLNES